MKGQVTRRSNESIRVHYYTSKFIEKDMICEQNNPSISEKDYLVDTFIGVSYRYYEHRAANL